MRELEYQARHSLTEHARARTCSLGGVGTGNVVRAHGHTLIVTAKHVTAIALLYCWMSYVTLVCADPNATIDFLFCQYLMNTPVRESRRLVKAALAAARGLGGAFNLKVPADVSQGPLIWSHTTAKVI